MEDMLFRKAVFCFRSFVLDLVNNPEGFESCCVVECPLVGYILQGLGQPQYSKNERIFKLKMY